MSTGLIVAGLGIAALGFAGKYVLRAVPTMSQKMSEAVKTLPKMDNQNQENPLEMYDDGQFRRRFRFTKDTVTHILLPIVFPDQGRTSNKGLPVPPLLQLLVALRYYATSSYQMFSGSKYYKGGFEAKMTKREASLILGVSPAANKNKVKEAHKRIMSLNHPDRGGSPYLAAKINEAKDYMEGGRQG